MTEEQRLAALRADERLPLVFLDVTIKVRSLDEAGRSRHAGLWRWRTTLSDSRMTPSSLHNAKECIKPVGTTVL